MKIKVNSKDIFVFEGATIRHAVMRYCVLTGMDTGMTERMMVFDRFGHETDMDAPASQHEEIITKTIQP